MAGGRVQIEVEGSNQKELFKQMAEVQEVFDISACGACKGKDIHNVVRHVEDNDFYEYHCQNPQCRARLAFGQNKKGNTLFPKRRDDQGKPLANGGWSKWDGTNTKK